MEVLGAGGFGSFNYERIIFQKKNFIYGVRLGVSTYHIEDYTRKFNPDIIVPLFINVCYGKNHKIEFGIGETISNTVYAGFTDLNPTRITDFHTNLSIGYRYQNPAGGIFFRCAYTPIIELYDYYKNWFGISFGYSF